MIGNQMLDGRHSGIDCLVFNVVEPQAVDLEAMDFMVDDVDSNVMQILSVKQGVRFAAVRCSGDWFCGARCCGVRGGEAERRAS